MMAYLLEKLKSSNAEERREAIKMLINRTVFDWVADRDEREIDFAIPDLGKALSDSDEEVRKLAIEAIRTQQQSFDGESIFEALPSIIEVLFDKNRESIRANASIIFRDAVIDEYDITNNISELKNLLSDTNESVKFGVTDALTFYFALKENWGEVINLLNHTDKDVRQEAAGTLGHYKITTKANIIPLIPNINQLLSDEDKEVRFVAARSLVKIANNPEYLKPALNLLIQFLSDTEKKIRHNAIESLGDSLNYKINCSSNLARDEWNIYEPVIQAFEALYKSKDETIQIVIARYLTNFFLHTHNYEKIEHLLQSKVPKVRERVIYELYGCVSFCEVDFSPLIPILLRIYLTDENEEVRKAAETRLDDFAGRKEAHARLILNELEKANIDSNIVWRFLERTNKAANRKKYVDLDNELNGLEGQAKLKRLKVLLQDESPVTKSWAAYTLYNLWGYSSYTFMGAVSELTKCLQDKDQFVRYYASSAVQFLKNKTISEVVPALIALLSDHLYEIRTNAIIALKKAFELGVNVSEAFPIIKKVLLTDEYQDVRAQASFFFYDAAQKGLDITSATEALITALSDPYDVVHDMCARTLARYLLTKPLAQRILEEIETRKLKKGSGITELINNCKKELKD
jgi:HEAT repeat protein